MLCKDHQSLKDWRHVKHKASVVPKAFDISLITGVKEDRTISWIEIIVYIFRIQVLVLKSLKGLAEKNFIVFLFSLISFLISFTILD